MTYRVEVSRRADREIRELFRYLAERSVWSAEKWRVGVFDTIDSLASNPERCPLSPESEWFDGVREQYYGKRRDVYRILFQVRGDTVYVLRVRHGRQNLLSPGDL